MKTKQIECIRDVELRIEELEKIKQSIEHFPSRKGDVHLINQSIKINHILISALTITSFPLVIQ